MHGNLLLILGGIIVAGFACQWIAWRVKLPSILLLLLTGIIAGPLLGWLEPDAVLGDLLEPFVSMAVAVILYAGSLTLKISGIRGNGVVVRRLLTIGVLTTWVMASAAAWYLLGWNVYLAALFGAIVTVSGPTVIAPMLRTVRPTKDLAKILHWEGVLIDPLGAILAVLVFEFIIVVHTAATPGQLFASLGLVFGAGVGLGAASGYVLGRALRGEWLPDFLRDYAALAAVILVFSVAELIKSESGLLAVTVMGVMQANMSDLDIEDILDFKESLTLVLVAALFIMLAARVDLGALAGLGLGAIGVFLFLQFVAGPARALLSSIGSDLSWRERIFLGWIFPRGIVAAAVSALFALRLEQSVFPGAEQLVPMVFAVIVGTVVVQSLSGSLVARLLDVADPKPTGVLIVGANPVALTYAEALQEAGHRVLVASMSWKGISEARMAGMPVYFGSPVARYAESHMDLTGLGHLLALSDRPDLNELACVRYKYEFGRNCVYTLGQRTETSEKYQISGQSAGRLLFGGEKSIEDLLPIASQGVEAHTTEITDSFTFQDYREKHPDAIVLFITDDDENLRFPVDEEKIVGGPGWKVTAVLPTEAHGQSERAAGSPERLPA